MKVNFDVLPKFTCLHKYSSVTAKLGILSLHKILKDRAQNISYNYIFQHLLSIIKGHKNRNY